MLAEPTVLVVGAGAGEALGMPVGSDLIRVIAQKLDISFADYGETPSGDPELREFLRRLSNEDDSLSAWVSASKAVASGVRYAKSIDEFLHIHEDDERLKVCAKLAIAQTILERERRSGLFIENAVQREWRDEDAVIRSWLAALVRLLGEGELTSSSRADFFKNLTIINFNYDRCIEHFLYNALQDLFRIGDTEAAVLMQTLPVYHPYGLVGALDWQGGKRTIPFGADRRDLLSLSREILTFHEQIEEGESLSAMREAMAAARRIVFLGFHFHEQNMRLLQTGPREDKDPADIYATFIHRSQADAEVVRDRLFGVLGPRGGMRITKLEHTSNCERLLPDYQSALSAPRSNRQHPWHVAYGPDNY